MLASSLPYISVKSRNNGCDNLAAALKNAHDRDLVFGARASDAALSLRKVQVASLAADERLIGLNLATKLSGRILMHGGPDTVKHVPSRLLRNADRAGKLAGANPVLAVGEEPVSAHPLIETEGAVFKNCAYLEAELPLASVALPDTARLDKGVTLRATARARNNTIWKPKIESALKGAVRIADVNNRFLKGARRFHNSNLRPIIACVKYIVALEKDVRKCVNAALPVALP